MSDDESREDIARIEAHIEKLAESIERCSKVSIAAKIMIAAGAAWIALSLILIVPFVPYAVIIAMAAVIGGFVLLGSNATTWTQTLAALRASEAMRTDMIERMQLKLVDGGVRRLH